MKLTMSNKTYWIVLAKHEVNREYNYDPITEAQADEFLKNGDRSSHKLLCRETLPRWGHEIDVCSMQPHFSM